MNARHKGSLKMPYVVRPYFYTTRRASGKVGNMEGRDGGERERVRIEAPHP